MLDAHAAFVVVEKAFRSNALGLLAVRCAAAASVTRLETHAGERSRAARGAGVGVLIGAVAGAVFGGLSAPFRAPRLRSRCT